ncbi:MAG: AAA family ATPase [Hyphomicrobiaceae bacterium]|nr:AAA family ATPase [Hyphomicrobiaceae bacterium]
MALFRNRGDNPVGADYRVDLPELRKRLRAHVAVNNAQIDGFPLILSIVGDPGVGKTYNIRQFARTDKVALQEISSSALAHHKEGMALFPMIRHYRDCGIVSEDQPAMLLIDDFDRSIASKFANVGHTIHSQLVVGFLMDLCDNPYSLPDEERRISVDSRRVPIIMTGNDFSGLDAALTRPQRMTILKFEPTHKDKLDMMRAAFSINGVAVLSDEHLAALERYFDGQSIAFYSDIVAEHLSDAMGKANHSFLGSAPDALRQFLAQEMIALNLKAAKILGERIARRTANRK